MNKGMTINMSMVEQDGKYNLGFNWNSSDGFKINREISGEDPEQAIDELLGAVIEELIEHYSKEEEIEEDKEPASEEESNYVKQLEKTIELLKKENNSLKVDKNVMQRRINNLVNEKKVKEPKEEKEIKSNVPRARSKFYFVDPLDYFFFKGF